MNVALVALLLAALPGRVIPPSQEGVLAPALGKGRALPEGCTWAGASIQPTFIESKYACDGRELTLRFEVVAVPDGAHQFSGPPGALAADVLAALDAAPLGWDVVLINEHDAVAPLTVPVVPRLAWLVLVVALFISLTREFRARTFTRPALADAALVFVAAFVLRAAVPWGPLDFAEPERLRGLWETEAVTHSAWSSFSTLFEPARLLGFPLFAYRWVGPLLGAATCVLVCVSAKKLGVSRAGAIIAGLVLATWPVHVRFSASGNAALLAALLWLAVLFFTLREAEALSPVSLVVLGCLVVLCVHARPEGRFVVLPLAVWAWKSPLTRRARLVFLIVTGAALLPYALENLVPSGSQARFGSGLAALWETLAARGVTPEWSLVAGLIGLALPGLSRTQRAQLGLVFAALVLTTCAYGSEDNPLWGHWRYLVPALPLVALGVGRAVELFGQNTPRRAASFGLVFALLPLLILRGVLLRPLDLQQEFQFVLRSAPTLPRDAKVVVDEPLTSDDPQTGMVHFELTPAMAAQLAGRVVVPATQPRGPASYVLFQGLARRLGNRRTVAPDELEATILRETQRVAPLALVLNSQCQPPPAVVRSLAPPVFGWALEDCEVEFSWVRLR